jgi:hypothetical protein
MVLSAGHALPRRTFLRGIGVTLALPLLDAMVPVMRAKAGGALSSVRRLGFVYVPNGAAMASWKPKGEGTQFELSPTLTPLAPFRDQLIIPVGLSQNQANAFGDGNGEHTRATAVWLNGVHPLRTEGADVRSGITVDQIAAAELGKDTPLASLELATEQSYLVGNCDNGYSCVYMNTLSWRTPTSPMPMEVNPRVVFERLFGDGDSAAARSRQRQDDASILDSVTKEISRLQRTVGASDSLRVEEYVSAVREIERRIQAQERQRSVSLNVPAAPIGIPETYEEHANLMFDLVALAFAADITRVFTLMLAKEQSNRPYPNLGVPDGHHGISHHQNDPVRLEKAAKINTYHISLLARFLEKLRSTPEGDGSVLDHAMILHGGGISDGDAHDHDDLPLVLVGGGTGQLKGGRVIKSAIKTPMNNLLLGLLDKVGVRPERFGDATGTLALVEPLSGV